jgi:hypothetical protein
VYRHGVADGVDADVVRQVRGEDRGGLRQPVALQQGDPDTVEEVAEPLAERRAGGDRDPQPTTERGLQLAVDQLAEDRVRQAGPEPDPAVVERLPGVVGGDVDGHAEDAALALRAAFCAALL